MLFSYFAVVVRKSFKWSQFSLIGSNDKYGFFVFLFNIDLFSIFVLFSSTIRHICYFLNNHIQAQRKVINHYFSVSINGENVQK